MSHHFYEDLLDNFNEKFDWKNNLVRNPFRASFSSKPSDSTTLKQGFVVERDYDENKYVSRTDLEVEQKVYDK